MKSRNHGLELEFALSLLLILSFIGLSLAVNICPVDKKPTEMSISHSQLPKNEPLGIDTNNINIQITLEWVDRTTGERGPLPGKNVTITMMILDKYLKMQPDGNFQLSSEESNFILPTDMDGNIDRNIVVDPFNPKKISYSITADYIPATKDVYIGSTANAKYTPTSMPLFSLAACLPLIIVLGMLMGAMYVSGRNPLGALDLSRAAFRVPGVERRAVKGTIKSIGSGLLKGAGGTLGDAVGRMAVSYVANKVKAVGSTMMSRKAIKRAFSAVVATGKGAVKTTVAVGVVAPVKTAWAAGKFAIMAPVEAYKSITRAKEVSKVKQSTMAQRKQPARKDAMIGPITKAQFDAAQKSKELAALAKKNIGVLTKEELKAGKGQLIGKEARIQGTEATGVLPVQTELHLSKFSVKESGKELATDISSMGRGLGKTIASSGTEIIGAFTRLIVDTFKEIPRVGIGVVNLTGGERSLAIAARNIRAETPLQIAEKLGKDNMWSTTEKFEVETARKKLKEGKISKGAFQIVLNEAERRGKLSPSEGGEHYDPLRKRVVPGGEIWAAQQDTKYTKKGVDEARHEVKDFINKKIEKKDRDTILSAIENEFKKSPAERFSLETVKKILASISIKDKELSKTFEGYLLDVVELNNGKNGLVSKINDENFMKDVFKAAGHFTSTSSKDPGKICQQYEGTTIYKGILTDDKETIISPANALEWITTNEKIKISAKYMEAEREVGAVYAAVELKKDTKSLEAILEGNLSPKDNEERVKETLTKLLKADFGKYIDTEGSFAQISMNLKRIEWSEINPSTQGLELFKLPAEDAEKFANGLKEMKFTDYLDKNMGLQDINEGMLGRMNISGKSAENILKELNNEKSELRSNIANDLKTINANAENYLGYDIDQLRNGKTTARMEQKLNELGISDKKDSIQKFAETGSAESIMKIISDKSIPDAEIANIVAETTASVRMTRENGTLLAGFLESRMTGGERNAYEPMLEKLREGKIEGTGGMLSDFVEKDKIKVKDFDKYVNSLTDFTQSNSLRKGGDGYQMIDRLRDLSVSAFEADLDIPKMKLMLEPNKISDAELTETFKELQSNLKEGNNFDPHSAVIGAEAAMANTKRQAILLAADGKLISSNVQAFGIAAGIKDQAGDGIALDINKTAIAANPKSKEQIEDSFKSYKDDELKERAKNITDTAKKLQIIEITKTEEKYTSKDNPLDKKVVETSKLVKLYDENVDQSTELFRHTFTGDIKNLVLDPKTNPDDAFVHINKSKDGGHIDLKNEELPKQRLNTFVVSAIENKVPYEIISANEIMIGGVSIKADKDKLYMTKKKTMTDKLFSKPGSDTSASA